MKYDRAAFDAAYRVTVPWARRDVCNTPAACTYSYMTEHRRAMEEMDLSEKEATCSSATPS